jgi:hypothetical protein
MGGGELLQDQPAEQSGRNAHQQKETGPAWCKPFAMCVAPEGALRLGMVEAPVNPLVDIQLTGAKPRVTGNDETQTAISHLSLRPRNSIRTGSSASGKSAAVGGATVSRPEYWHGSLGACRYSNDRSSKHDRFNAGSGRVGLTLGLSPAIRRCSQLVHNKFSPFHLKPAGQGESPRELPRLR